MWQRRSHENILDVFPMAILLNKIFKLVSFLESEIQNLTFLVGHSLQKKMEVKRRSELEDYRIVLDWIFL